MAHIGHLHARAHDTVSRVCACPSVTRVPRSLARDYALRNATCTADARDSRACARKCGIRGAPSKRQTRDLRSVVGNDAKKKRTNIPMEPKNRISRPVDVNKIGAVPGKPAPPFCLSRLICIPREKCGISLKAGCGAELLYRARGRSDTECNSIGRYSVTRRPRR